MRSEILGQSRGAGPGFLQLRSRNDPEVHLIRPVDKAQCAAPSVKSRKWRVRSEPHCAEYLHGPIDHPDLKPGRYDLDGRDIDARGLVTVPVDPGCRSERQQPRLINFDARLRNPVLDIGEVGELAGKGLPLESPRAHQLQRQFALSDCPHAVVNAPGTETGLG